MHTPLAIERMQLTYTWLAVYWFACTCVCAFHDWLCISFSDLPRFLATQTSRWSAAADDVMLLYTQQMVQHVQVKVSTVFAGVSRCCMVQWEAQGCCHFVRILHTRETMYVNTLVSISWQQLALCYWWVYCREEECCCCDLIEVLFCCSFSLCSWSGHVCHHSKRVVSSVWVSLAVDRAFQFKPGRQPFTLLSPCEMCVCQCMPYFAWGCLLFLLLNFSGTISCVDTPARIRNDFLLGYFALSQHGPYTSILY